MKLNWNNYFLGRLGVQNKKKTFNGKKQPGNGLLGVSNGLCEHLRACEQCVYFCEHEQLSYFSCEQRADGEQRPLRVLRKINFPLAEISLLLTG